MHIRTRLAEGTILAMLIGVTGLLIAWIWTLPTARQMWLDVPIGAVATLGTLLAFSYIAALFIDWSAFAKKGDVK